MLRRKCLKRKGRNKRVEVGTKSEKVEWELEGKLPPFSAFFFFSMIFFLCFFFAFFCLRKRRCQKKMFETKGQNWEGKNGSQKWKGKVGAWKKVPSLFYIFFLFMVFLFFSSTWKEKDARRKHLKQKAKSGKVETGAKSERVEWELEGKLLPFSAFFFSDLWFSFSSFFFSCAWEEENAKRKRLKQKGKNGKVEVRTKSERWCAPKLFNRLTCEFEMKIVEE